MRIVFLAERECSLTAGGVLLGMIDGFCRSAEICPSDGVFFEIAPREDFLPVRFRLDEKFLLDPPPHIRLYFSEDAVAVYACEFVRADQSLRIVRQERIGGALLTLTVQGKVQLNLETEKGFFLVPLPDAFEDASFTAHGNHFLLKGADAFALVDRAGKILLLSEGRILSEGEPLEGEIDFRDSRGHTARCTWQDGVLLSCSIRAAREVTETTLALALFESVLIGADCGEYLSEPLREKADSLRDFLGDFLSVVLTDAPDVAGLVYRRKERIFDVRYFRIEQTEGKISNILPLEEDIPPAL